VVRPIDPQIRTRFPLNTMIHYRYVVFTRQYEFIRCICLFKENFMRKTAFLSLLLPLVAVSAHALEIQFRIYENDPFFVDHPRRMNLLNEAAQYYRGFTDSLNPIVESGNSTWSAKFTLKGAAVTIPHLVVPQDTLIIYVGSANIGSLGRGGSGGFSARGSSSDFFTNIRSRGQLGAQGSDKTDFARWGGGITFDTQLNGGAQWAFDQDSGDANTYNFLSVAIHEIGHVLGLTSSNESWTNHRQGNLATGPYVTAQNQGSVQLDMSSGGSHFANSTQSVRLDGTSQEVAMDPNISNGNTVKLLTKLDYAAFKDIGWEVPHLNDLPGDTDNNQIVDGEDLLNVKNQFGSKRSYARVGDLNGDGWIDLDDLFEVRNYFSRRPSPASIPEPTSFVLLALGGIGMIRRK